MYILTQDKNQIINTEKVHRFSVSVDRISADETILGFYSTETRAKGVFNLILKALCQNCMVNTYKGSYSEADFCYEMPPDTEEVDKQISQADYLQKVKSADKRWKALVKDA